MDWINRLMGGFSESLIAMMTNLVNAYSGILQGLVFIGLALVFSSALVKTMLAYRRLTPLNREDIIGRNLFLSQSASAPLCVIAAAFLVKTRHHYAHGLKSGPRPPDDYLKDAAFQYSERYFQEQVLEPISMTANLLPPLGFIGTIMGMALHFITGSGSINTQATAAGVAVALYSTLLALTGFIIIEFLKKNAYTLSQKRIADGLRAVFEADAEDAETGSRAMSGLNKPAQGVGA